MKLSVIDRFRSGVMPLTAAALFVGSVLAAPSVSAYAPNVGGRVYTDTGAPISGVWVQWESNEAGNDKNEVNRGTHYRYSGTTESGRFFFKGWDLDGVRTENGQVYSMYGQTEFDERIDLNYDTADGKESRRASSNQYNIFNCNNEVNTFSLRLPASLKDAVIQARWRRDNSTRWTSWTENRVSMPKDIFNNSHDYEMEFRVTPPKQSSIRDLDRNIDRNSLADVSTLRPACLKTDLCTADGKTCSTAFTPASGKHRVLLSRLGDNGIGDAQRKLAAGDGIRPLWLTECVQTGSALSPAYTCTTGNSELDRKVFLKDNATELRNKYGYSARIFYSDGVTETNPEITAANRRDAYEWETTVDPERVKPGQLTSIFIAMWDPGQSSPPASGDTPTQLQATLSSAEGCRLVIDPYGRAFDSFTLEPLAGVSVVLARKRPGGSYSPVVQSDVVGVIQNPQTTSRDGLFSFLVPPGTYRLSASREGYVFPAGNLSPLARQMYANLYIGQELIVSDKLIHTDIPLEPLNPGEAIAYAKNNPIRIQSYFQIVDPQNGVYRIEGSVSHPLATINLYTGDEARKLLHTAAADVFGYFRIALRLDSLDENVRITQLEAKKKAVPAFESSGNEFMVMLDPVLRDLDGFAVDKGGKLLSNAGVGLYIGGSEVPVYRTTADVDGRFTVPRDALPHLPYRVGFAAAGIAEERISAAEFIARNAMLSHPRNVYMAKGPDSSGVLGDYSISRPGIHENLGTGPLNSMNDDLNARSSGTIILALAAVIGVVTSTVLLISYFRRETKRSRRHG